VAAGHAARWMQPSCASFVMIAIERVGKACHRCPEESRNVDARGGWVNYARIAHYARN
jgi:hypothetical protein